MMKRMILAMAIFSMAFALQAQKFGHVTSETLLQAMPEYDSARVKIEAFNQAETTMSDLIKEAKASEIQEMQTRLQNFSQTANQDLQQQQMVLIQPVMDKARQAIDAVAKEHGLIYVFDLSQGNPIYTSEESLDMEPLVKAKLGLQ